jgi:hypothetical protein
VDHTLASRPVSDSGPAGTGGLFEQAELDTVAIKMLSARAASDLEALPLSTHGR